ncbi:MAG: ribosome assembly RNA-binding protein YhbY [Lachnospiraceae bacterium]|nr:ribosome assembly RNA-binding protein YhbY [Lachnospiraceae bacterium]
MIKNSKQRAYLKSLAMDLDAIIRVGHEGVTPEFVSAVDEALASRELIKISVLKSCEDDVKSVASTTAERTRSDLVQVIGRKFVLYREGKDEKKKIVLP